MDYHYLNDIFQIQEDCFISNLFYINNSILYFVFLIWEFSLLSARSFISRMSSVKGKKGNVLEGCLSMKKMKSEKVYRENHLGAIVTAICALLNSYSGGKFNIKFEDESVLPEEIDAGLRMIEQSLVDIIGSCTFCTKVRIQRSKVNNLDFFVTHTESLCTVDYKLYLPTQTQVIPISPCETPEKVKAILNRNVDQQLTPLAEIEDFVFDRRVSFTEGDSIQFKQLKAANSKCVSFADRVTNKSNKLERYFSAFANKDGGRLYYGITDNGTVKGEYIEEKSQKEIVRKVTKTISSMKWRGGTLQRGTHWNIQFVPIKDDDMNEKSFMFVVIISVKPIRDGLFTQEPESYHVVKGQVERMSFSDWENRFFHRVECQVPSLETSRTKWSSVRVQKTCHKILQQLVEYHDNADYEEFEKLALLAEEKYPGTVIAHVVLAERTVVDYKRGQFEKADTRLAQLENCLSSLSPAATKDYVVLKLRTLYAKSAISRAKGNYQESYDLAKECLRLAEMAPAGILTAWFYNQVAIMEKRLSQMSEAASASLIQSSKDHYIKALQHIQASNVEQEFSTTTADLRQRVHTFRPITTLGDFANGPNFRNATPSDIEEAKADLVEYHRVHNVEGHSVTSYREVYYLFAKSDLRLCQWWQQRQRKRENERSLENYGIPKFLKEAFDSAQEAKDRAIHFDELRIYANNRLAVTVEMILKLKVSSLRPPRSH